MDQSATILTALFFVGIGALLVIRLNRADDATDERANGDWPHVPNEFHSATHNETGA